MEAVPPGGTAVLNADDPLVAAMAERTEGEVVTFGRSPDAVVRAEDETLDERGRARFTLVTPEGTAPVALRLHGAHAVPNALAAAAAARAAGLAPDAVAAALSDAVPVSRWRMEVTERADGVTVVNDAYNANPDSTRAALDVLAHMARGRRAYAVLGRWPNWVTRPWRNMPRSGSMSRAAGSPDSSSSARTRRRWPKGPGRWRHGRESAYRWMTSARR